MTKIAIAITTSNSVMPLRRPRRRQAIGLEGRCVMANSLAEPAAPRCSAPRSSQVRQRSAEADLADRAGQRPQIQPVTDGSPGRPKDPTCPALRPGRAVRQEDRDRAPAARRRRLRTRAGRIAAGDVAVRLSEDARIGDVPFANQAVRRSRRVGVVRLHAEVAGAVLPAEGRRGRPSSIATATARRPCPRTVSTMPP